MTITEVLLAIPAIGGLATGAAALIYNRKTPVLTQAQADSELVDIEAVRLEIARSSQALQAERDLRNLDIERWGDRIRPVLMRFRERDDIMARILVEWSALLGLPIPEIPSLPDVPEFPPPRVLHTTT